MEFGVNFETDQTATKSSCDEKWREISMRIHVTFFTGHSDYEEMFQSLSSYKVVRYGNDYAEHTVVFSNDTEMYPRPNSFHVILSLCQGFRNSWDEKKKHDFLRLSHVPHVSA